MGSFLRQAFCRTEHRRRECAGPKSAHHIGVTYRAIVCEAADELLALAEHPPCPPGLLRTYVAAACRRVGTALEHAGYGHSWDEDAYVVLRHWALGELGEVIVGIAHDDTLTELRRIANVLLQLPDDDDPF